MNAKIIFSAVAVAALVLGNAATMRGPRTAKSPPPRLVRVPHGWAQDLDELEPAAP